MPSLVLALDSDTTQKPPASSRCKTLVVDDSSTILHAICALLSHDAVVDVVGRAHSGPEALDVIRQINPELALIDADMPAMGGLMAALLISRMHPAVQVVLMSMDVTPQFQAACASCGASAVIYKPRFRKELAAWLQDEEQTPPGKRNGLRVQA